MLGAVILASHLSDGTLEGTIAVLDKHLNIGPPENGNVPSHALIDDDIRKNGRSPPPWKVMGKVIDLPISSRS
jgi:hypothetical protein